MENIERKTQFTIRYTLYAIFIALLCLILPQTVQAAEYYLDAMNGDDANPGTSDAPWKTIARAYSTYSGSPKVAADDTVIIRNGSYGDFILPTSYSNTNWITYQAASGHLPVFNKIQVYPSSNRNVYLKFDGIKASVPDPGYDPNNPPWSFSTPFYFRNANYVQVLNCIAQNWTKYATTPGIYFVSGTNFTVEHCDVSLSKSGISTDGVGSIVRQNHVHTLAAGHGISVTGTDCIVELNHIHGASKDKYDDFYPPDVGYLDPVVWSQSNDPGFQVGEDVVTPPTGTPIRGGKILKYEWLNGKWTIYVEELWPYAGEMFRTGYVWKTQTTNVTFTLQSYSGGIHTEAGLSVRASNAVIRKNVIHDWPHRSIYFYNGYGGYENMVVENNLIYDSGYYADIGYLKGATVFRNNTFIGALSNTGLYFTGGTMTAILARYLYAFTSHYQGTFDGTGVRVYNNVIVSPYALPDPTNPSYNKYSEDYNIWWSNVSTGANTKQGANSKILVWRTGVSPYTKHGWPNYFEFANYTDDTEEYDYSVEGVTPFFVSPGFKTNPSKIVEGFYVDHGKVWDYRLIEGSPGINFGATQVATWEQVLSGQVTGPSQPPDSLGSLGADGFIRDDGPARDTNHHSAGCYEYVAQTFLYGDVNGDGEITAYDAALAAHIAVDLEHQDIKNRAAAEVSGDGEVTAYDAALIAQYSVGLISKFPVE